MSAPNQPAFPQAMAFGASGMSLRDWFAGQALAGITSPPHHLVSEPTYTARTAYAFADAMLVARAKAKGEA